MSNFLGFPPMAEAALIQGRLPLPLEGAVEEAERLGREIFKDDYARKAPSDRLPAEAR